MVLFDGQLITATKSNEYKDIFWSTCGGGAGLGIITELTASYTLAEDTVEKFSFGNVFFKTQNSLKKQAKMIHGDFLTVSITQALSLCIIAHNVIFLSR